MSFSHRDIAPSRETMGLAQKPGNHDCRPQARSCDEV